MSGDAREALVGELVGLMLRQRSVQLGRRDVRRRAIGLGLDYMELAHEAAARRPAVRAVPWRRLRDAAAHGRILEEVEEAFRGAG